jgi:hypothetical protein
MQKFLFIYLFTCLKCFGLSFSPSSEAGVQLRQWFKSPGYCQRPGADTIPRSSRGLSDENRKNHTNRRYRQCYLIRTYGYLTKKYFRLGKHVL